MRFVSKELETSKVRNSNWEELAKEHDTKQKLWKGEKKSLEEKAEQLEKEVDVLKAQENIWKREVESLRALVKSFDDLPLSPMKKGRPGGGPTDAEDDSSPSSTQATVKTLEVELEAAKSEIKLLKESQEALTSDLKRTIADKTELQRQHNSVLEKYLVIVEAIKKERVRAQKAENRAIEAEQLAGKGSFDPEQTRVVYLKKNPLVEALRQEVSVLKRQVAALSGEEKPNSIDPGKYHQRLTKSFKEQIGIFREAVHLMTGYKIDMLPGERPTFKVRSRYAEREEDHLIFKWPEGDDVKSLDLLSTKMAKLLTTTPSYEYMTRFDSLPAFLASVQLALFEKQTVM